MKEITLTKGYVALVDDKDFERASKYKWHAQVNHKTVYALHSLGNDKLALHRFILGVEDSSVKVDHRDRNGLNCQRHNLRKASIAENNRNGGMRSNNKCGFKGVYWHKATKKWHASIRSNHKHFSLGYFNTPEEASEAYKLGAKKHHGTFAAL